MKKNLSFLLFSVKENPDRLKKILRTAWLCSLLVFLAGSYVAAQQIQARALRQIQSLMDEKALRTPAQKKIASQILYASKMRSGQRLTAEVATLETDVKVDTDGRIKVDIEASVTPQLLAGLRAMGADIVFSSAKFGNVVAKIPLNKVERAAALNDIRHINYWLEPLNNHHYPERNGNTGSGGDRTRYTLKSNNSTALVFNTRAKNVFKQLNTAFRDIQLNGKKAFFAGSVTSEADVTHKAAQARATFGVDGSGVKIGVLSNGVGGYTSSQASGDLPANITILPGQSGTGAEGRAMMELIYDLAPGAQLYFATANTSQASFAQNILDLRAAGCDIIVDDVSYYAEGVFQDDNVAQAINVVTASGALYFSSAGNSGNKDNNTSGVWEGDFKDGGSIALFPGGTVNDFGGGVLFNTITSSTGVLTLKWSDPLEASVNDYDLFVTNSTGTAIVSSSTNIQDGNDNPYESVSASAAGQRIYILKKTGAAARALHLNTNRGMLNFSTPGVMYGHNAAASVYTVAATPAAIPYGPAPNPAGPFPGVFTTASRVETFSSDGPRRMFFNPDGSAITPGNLLFATGGGTVLQKPDITAADGTKTTTPGFNPFFGTSAAAPHAAAIAALIKSKLPAFTPAQIRASLISSTLDIEGPGFDRNTGAGIIMAFEALQAAGAVPGSAISLSGSTTTEGAYGNKNGFVEPGELGSMTVQLTNPSGIAATNVSAVLTTTTPGVSITRGTANYGDIAGGGSATNTASPYLFGVNAAVPCGTSINFVLTVTYGGGGTSPKTFPITVVLTAGTPSISGTLGFPAPSGTSFTSSSGTQTNRLIRNGVQSGCSPSKISPGVETAGSLAYHAYTFTNSSGVSECVTVNFVSSAGANLYCVAYNNGGFVPANPGSNYLADPGTAANSMSYNFSVPGLGLPFTIVVSESSPGAGVGTNYSLSVGISGRSLIEGIFTCAPAPACTPVVLSPASLTQGRTGMPYSQIFIAAGGSGSYIFSLSGALPAGLGFTGNTLSGTPTQTGSFPITVTATDATGCPAGVQHYTLVISDSPVCESPLAQAYVASTQTGNQGHRGELGYQFIVNNPSGISIKQLGAFDDGGNGITGTQGGGIRVAVFDRITHTIVPGLDATITGLGDAYTGNHRMKNITPVTLPPGDYMVVAKGYNSDERNGNIDFGGGPYPEGNNGAGAITFGPGAGYGPDDPNGFAYPATAGNFGTTHQYLAGSFAFTTPLACQPADANLSNLQVSPGALTPAFAPATISYTVSVPNSAASINITPAAAAVGSTIKINGNTVAGGTPLAVNLSEGANTINIVVTASDGTTSKTYTVTVTRAAASTCYSASAQAYIANTQMGTQGFQGELGMEFIVNNANGIIINQLGAFDHAGNGIAGTQPGGAIRVAVFNRATQTIVPGLDVSISGLADAYTGNHRMKNITPVTLPAGDYVIVAKGYGAAEFNGNLFSGGGPFPSGNDGGGAISFGSQSSYGADDPNGFSYPSTEGNFGSSNVFLAGSFSFTSVIPCGDTCESTPALAYISGTQSGNQAYHGELGMQFIVKNPGGIRIKQLGAFDDGGNGITGTQPGGSIRVAIFNRATRAVVPGLDVNISGTADAYTGNHRMKNITPVVLPRGDYVVVAKGYGEHERNGNMFNGGGTFSAGDNSGGAINFGGISSYGVDDPGGAFGYPATEGNFGSSNVFLAGTFNYTVNISCQAPAVANGTITNSVMQTPADVKSTVKIYPNPTNGRFNLQLTNVDVPKISIQVINASGQLVDQKTVAVFAKTALLNVSFNLLHLPPGLYMLKMQSSEGVKTEKLVIQR